MVICRHHKQGAQMPFDTLIVTVVVVAGFVAFAGTLAWVSWRTNQNHTPQ